VYLLIVSILLIFVSFGIILTANLCHCHCYSLSIGFGNVLVGKCVWGDFLTTSAHVAPLLFVFNRDSSVVTISSCLSLDLIPIILFSRASSLVIPTMSVFYVFLPLLIIYIMVYNFLYQGTLNGLTLCSNRLGFTPVILANLNFIPAFVAKDFSLGSTAEGVFLAGKDLLPQSNTSPVVILAHGFLGSRFDLSHLGEALAKEGFICLSPEYPESLASSYDNKEGLDRSIITNQLLQYIRDNLDLNPVSMGIVGHSLGCGTAFNTGDETWTRVCIAGPPARRDGVEMKGRGILAITSLNDGLVSRDRLEAMIPRDFARLDEMDLRALPQETRIPPKSILIIDRDDGPNHISFLAGNVNDCMVGFLSPLLPVAQALQIPVLDFDKYQESRDSVATSEVVIPLVSSFLKQYMM